MPPFVAVLSQPAALVIGDFEHYAGRYIRGLLLNVLRSPDVQSNTRKFQFAWDNTVALDTPLCAIPSRLVCRATTSIHSLDRNWSALASRKPAKSPPNMGDSSKDPDSMVRSSLPAAGLNPKLSGRAANVANIASPPGSKTPPSMSSRRTLFFPEPSARQQKSRTEAEPVDADALAMALKKYEEAGHRRDRTPGSSPCRKRQRVYGDR